MRVIDSGSPFTPESVLYTRCTIDLATGDISIVELPCANLEDVLGGFGRSFQLLEQRDVNDAFSTANPLIVNTGILTGTNVMTGLRAYFSAYSPLKSSDRGLPAAMWSAASGKFGSKLKWTGLDEIVCEHRSPRPVIVVARETERGPVVELKSAEHLLGLSTHEKIMALRDQYDDAHFAVIGPAGERYEQCYFAAVAVSTENQLRSGDDKCRFAGRGGMGTVMGSKQVIAFVAQSQDQLPKITPEMKALNRTISTGPGSAKFRERSRGGLGGTWTNYEPMEKWHIVPQYNFRPSGDGKVDLLSRTTLEDDDRFLIRAESCFRCGINCHKNIYERKADGSQGEFRAKFDYEPLNLLTTNLGIDDPEQAWQLVRLVDNLGMDSISCGTTVGYVLDYNARHPEAPILDGATFGDFEKVHRLIDDTGNGRRPEVGHGVKRLSVKMGETGYAMHVKGLELPAYLPETNPGYAWAIAGGHMSMATYLALRMEKDTSLDYWVTLITTRGLYQVRDDLIGVCKFAGVGGSMPVDAVKAATGLDIPAGDLKAAVRRAFLRGLKLELKQGYTDAEYTLPGEVFERPNEVLKAPAFVTPEFFAELKSRVRAVFEPEIRAL
jgi:aldehyde:ferredoxin oxidoreductase